jgi:hypothetical protein
LRKEAVIVRGDGSYDELPEFDVVRVADEFVEDEDGKQYRSGVDFVIRYYNNLTWLGTNRPAQGKRYTMTFFFRPTYRIFQKEPSRNFSENKRFPSKCMLRLFEKAGTVDFTRVDY